MPQMHPARHSKQFAAYTIMELSLGDTPGAGQTPAQSGIWRTGCNRTKLIPAPYDDLLESSVSALLRRRFGLRQSSAALPVKAGHFPSASPF